MAILRSFCIRLLPNRTPRSPITYTNKKYCHCVVTLSCDQTQPLCGSSAGFYKLGLTSHNTLVHSCHKLRSTIMCENWYLSFLNYDQTLAVHQLDTLTNHEQFCLYVSSASSFLLHIFKQNPFKLFIKIWLTFFNAVLRS